MYKQSNVTSKLLDEMVKAAENAKPREFRNDFLDQITPILETKPQTLAEIFAEVMKKKAQGLDPAESLGPEGGIEDELAAPDAVADPLADEMAGGDDPAGDLGGGADLGTSSLADQLRSLADQVEQLEGGGEDELGGLEDDVDISGVDEEIPTDTAVGDMTGSEDAISIPETEPKPMVQQQPQAQPMYMAMANHLKKNASQLRNTKCISRNQ